MGIQESNQQMEEDLDEILGFGGPVVVLDGKWNLKSANLGIC